MMLSLFFISIKVLKPLAFVLDCAGEPYIPVVPRDPDLCYLELVPIVCSIDVYSSFSGQRIQNNIVTLLNTK